MKIVSHELKHLVRDGRLRIVAVLGIFLFIAMAMQGYKSYQLEHHERQQFELGARQQWENQGEKQPHRAAHFGFYLTKPELSLALYDSGIKPAAGQILLLEAHQRSAFTYSPAEDSGDMGILGVNNSAELLQALGVMFIILMAYSSIAREREDGTLRLLLAQGVSPTTWLFGKILGLAMALAIVAMPIMIGLTILFIAGSPTGMSLDLLLRIGLLMIGHFVYFGAWLMGSIAISTWAKSARSALSILLMLWVAGVIIAPRLANNVSALMAPIPSVEDLDKQKSNDFTQGFEGTPGWEVQLAMLEKKTLAEYGVKSLNDLPVGFSGIRMLAMDEFSGRISDRHQQRLESIYANQNHWQLVTSSISPYVPMRAFSQIITGMDWQHYLHFSETGEAYRRVSEKMLNTVLKDQLKGNKWEINVGSEVWGKIPQFQYQWPSIQWVIQQALLPFSLLFFWLSLSFIAAIFGIKRLRP